MGRGRVLLRASGTEPVIRVMVESDCAKTNQQVADLIVAAVQNAANLLQQ
jgi:Phosphomannomutase